MTVQVNSTSSIKPIIELHRRRGQCLFERNFDPTHLATWGVEGEKTTNQRLSPERPGRAISHLHRHSHPVPWPLPCHVKHRRCISDRFASGIDALDELRLNRNLVLAKFPAADPAVANRFCDDVFHGENRLIVELKEGFERRSCSRRPEWSHHELCRGKRDY